MVKYDFGVRRRVRNSKKKVGCGTDIFARAVFHRILKDIKQQCGIDDRFIILYEVRVNMIYEVRSSFEVRGSQKSEK